MMKPNHLSLYIAKIYSLTLYVVEKYTLPWIITEKKSAFAQKPKTLGTQSDDYDYAKKTRELSDTVEDPSRLWGHSP